MLLEHDVKCRNKGLSQPEREDELGAGHEKLRDKAFEEGRKSFVLRHVGEDAEAALGVVEVAVLNSGLNNIEGSGNDQRGRGTSDRSNKVLEPGSLVIILEVEKVFLGKSRATEKLCRNSLVDVRRR